MYRKLVCAIGFSLAVMAVSVEADTLSGFSDITAVGDAIVSLRYAGTEYVVANDDLMLGTTTRWYIPAATGVATLWKEGDPVPAATTTAGSPPKAEDPGSEGDNFLFRRDGQNDMSSIDAINYQETVFPALTKTIFVFERGGNDTGTFEAILPDGSLGPAVAFTTAAKGGPFADTKVNVGGQNAFGTVFTTDVPVKGVRINAPGFDALSVSALKVSATITVNPNEDIAAANALAQAGDTIEIAAGTYLLQSQIAIKDGVTYRGAGPGLTILDGNNATRAFVAWGDRFFNEDNPNANNSGQKNWVLEGMTIRNCVSNTNDRFSYLSAAFNLKTNFATRDTDASGGLSPAEADAQVGGIRLAGPDGTEGTADDDLHRFAQIDKDADGVLSAAELDAQLLLREDEFGDQDADGGALILNSGAVGAIRKCEFRNNHTPAGGGDDGGAIKMSGLSTLTLEDCLFDGNYAVSADSTAVAGGDGDAGHVKVEGGSASALTPGTTLIANRCTFLNGNASDDGGAIQTAANGSIVRLDACWFEGNTSWDNGNVLAIGNEGSGELTVTNCIFTKNNTKADNSPDRMCEVRRNSKFVNCTFVGNHQHDEDLIYNNADVADTNADGVDDETTDATQVINCIFANNTFGADASNDHILSSRNAAFGINAVNCLFFNNLEADGKTLMANTNRTQTGSITTDPLLDAATYAPTAGSPAIDAGVDPATVGVTLKTDYDGKPRPQGAGYDIGACESGPAAPAN